MQSLAKTTFRPISSDSRPATGCRLNSGATLPFGRPRCEARITVAPVSSAYVIVGSDALIRVSSRDRAALERHVEVDADEDPLALQIQVGN